MTDFGNSDNWQYNQWNSQSDQWDKVISLLKVIIVSSNIVKDILGDRYDVPIPVYDLAVGNGCFVLKRNRNVSQYERENSENSEFDYKAICYTRKSFITYCKGLYERFGSQYDKYNYYLVLESDDPLERRVIVAYYLSKLRDKPKLGRKGVDIMQYIPNDSNYNNALKLLVPKNDLVSTLRDKGSSKIGCLYRSTLRYDLCLKYLISMEDMQNRLRLR